MPGTGHERIYPSNDAWEERRNAALKTFVEDACSLTRRQGKLSIPRETGRLPGEEVIATVCEVAQLRLAPLLPREEWGAFSAAARGAASTAWRALWRAGQLSPDKMNKTKRVMVESVAQLFYGTRAEPGLLDLHVEIECRTCGERVKRQGLWSTDICKGCFAGKITPVPKERKGAPSGDVVSF